MKRTLSVIFLIVFLAEVIGIYLDSDIQWVTRPLITVVLIIYYSVESQVKSPLMLLGLVTALLGDMFLLLPEGAGFTLWAFVFVLSYVIYATLFNKARQRSQGPYKYLYLAGAIIALSVIGVYLIMHTQRLKPLLISQVVAGLLMVVFSILRSDKLPGYFIVVIGSVLLVSGHVLTSMYHMVDPINYGKLASAGLYGIGLYLIVEGCIKGDELLAQL